MKVHPAADAFPMLDPQAFDELKSSIRDHDQKVPCVVWRRDDEEDVLLDGRNRMKACLELGQDVVLTPFFGDAEQALNLIVALNLKRRNLTTSQRAVIAADLVPMYADACREAKREGNRKGGGDRKSKNRSTPNSEPSDLTSKNDRAALGRAASVMNVGRTTVAEARTLKGEDREAVRRGEETVHGARQRSAPKPEKDTLYAKALKAVRALNNKQWERLKQERDND